MDFVVATDCLILSLLAQAQPASSPQPHLDNTTWIALGLGVAATMYVLMRARRKPKDPLEHKPITMPLAQQRSVERQMSNLLIELSDMSRELSASLDTRAAKLSALIDDADKRIAELRALNESSSIPTTAQLPAPSKRIEAAIIESNSASRSTDPAPPNTDVRHDDVCA